MQHSTHSTGCPSLATTFHTHIPESVCKLQHDVRNVVESKIKETQETLKDRIAAFKALIERETHNLDVYREFEKARSHITIGYSEVKQWVRETFKNPSNANQVMEVVESSEKEFLGEIDGLVATLKFSKEYIDSSRRWKSYGLNELVMDTNPDLVEFLMKSGAGRLIAMYQNSTDSGKKNHSILLSTDGPCLRVQGQLMPWTELKNLIYYNNERDEIVSVNDSQTVWTYKSPEGFVPLNRFEYDEVYPIEQLNPYEYERLRIHGEKFWGAEQASDSYLRDCVVQVVTTHRSYLPANWFTENLENAFPAHVSLRVIDKTGKVFSFGAQMLPEDEFDIIGSLPFSFLKTATTKIPSLDYEEPRDFEVKRVTSFTVSSEKKQKLLDWVAKCNKTGIRFNFVRQNCCKFTQEGLNLIDFPLDTRISFPTYFASVMPNLEKVPFVGMYLSYVASTISTIANAVFTFANTYVPEPFLLPVKLAYTAYDAVVSCIRTVFVNTLVFILGGAQSSRSVIRAQDSQDNSVRDDGLFTFSRILSHPLDFFKESNFEIYHSAMMIDWQNKQKTTVEYRPENKIPKLYLLPVEVLPSQENQIKV